VIGFACATARAPGCALSGGAVGGLAAVLTGIVNWVPTFSGVSGVRPFATAISLTLTRYLWATLPNVSPDVTL
jgi:multisubunit Na+/H+ antiporter MnhB subunit